MEVEQHTSPLSYCGRYAQTSSQSAEPWNRDGSSRGASRTGSLYRITVLNTVLNTVDEDEDVGMGYD